jgi:transcriptional regulator with XRE-family HTH domain
MDDYGLDMIGKRIRQVRGAREMSLEVLANLVGKSKSWLWSLEHGEFSPTLKQVGALADALRISLPDLVRLPVPAPLNGDTDGAIEDTRRALEAVSHGVPGGVVCPVEVLRERVDGLYRGRAECRVKDVGVLLPSLIVDLHASITGGRDVPELLSLAVKTHVYVTARWLGETGAPSDLRRQVAGIARGLASEHGSPALVGVASVGSVDALVDSGMFDLAAVLVGRLPVLPVTTETTRLVGELTLLRALVAVLSGCPADSEAPLEEARLLAARVGEPTLLYDECGSAFGLTDVGLYSMDIAMESEEPGRALEIGRTINPRQHPWLTRQSAYWVWVGRGLSITGRPEDAVVALMRAEKVSPARLHRNSFARDVLMGLLVNARRNSVGMELRGLAYRAGLPVQPPR